MCYMKLEGIKKVFSNKNNCDYYFLTVSYDTEPSSNCVCSGRSFTDQIVSVDVYNMVNADWIGKEIAFTYTMKPGHRYPEINGVKLLKR